MLNRTSLGHYQVRAVRLRSIKKSGKSTDNKEQPHGRAALFFMRFKLCERMSEELFYVSISKNFRYTIATCSSLEALYPSGSIL
jgi:hypothetical protein